MDDRASLPLEKRPPGEVAEHRSWRVCDVVSVEARRHVLDSASPLIASTRFAALYQNPEWHFADAGDWTRAVVLAWGNDSCYEGFAPFYVQDRPLRFLLGEVTWASIPLRRLTLFGEPLIASTDETSRTAALVALLTELRSRLAPREALFFEGIATDGLAWRVLTGRPEVARQFVALSTCPNYEHQFIEMPDSYDAYLGQLGSRSRGSLRNSERKLEREMDGRVRVTCFEAPDSVATFLGDGESISRKTYQWKLLGLGLRSSEALRKRLQYSASRGWLRSYILYCKDLPVAFIYGYQYAGCYYIIDGGYDPEYANLSVGSVLQMKIFQDLYERGPHPILFDFATGFGTHKARYGNLGRMEGELLLLPNTLANRCLAGAFRGSARASAATIGFLERFGVKERLKKAIRRLSTRS
jgi:CelD/BcsL family acetyltransferase involved in cellulose biosynthesis